MILLVLFITVGILATIYSVWMLRSLYYPKRLQKIRELIEAGKIKVASKSLEDLIDKDDRNAEARYLLAKCYQRGEQPQRAIVELKYITKMGRYTGSITESMVRKELANIYKKLNSFQDAQKEFLILTKIAPGDFSNFLEVGVLFRKRGKIETAVNYFRKAVTLNPKCGDAYFELGHIYYQLNRLPEAKKAFLKALKINPQFFRAHYYLGLILMQAKDYDSAIREFDLASRDQEIKARALLAKGQALYEKGDARNAVVQLERGLKVSEKKTDMVSLNLHYYLGIVLESIREIPAAISHWEKVLEVKKSFRDVNERLLAYQELRTDDRLKDLMIASNTAFEEQCVGLIKAMGLYIINSELEDENSVLISASEAAGKWRNTRRSNKLIRIIRTTKPITELEVRNLHEQMKKSNAMRAILITTGTVTSNAADYVVTRPVDIVDKTALVDLLKKVGTAPPVQPVT